MTSTKPTPRFVPTLTEVVRPGPTVAPGGVDYDLLLERVMQRVSAQLETRLTVALQMLVQEQVHLMAPVLLQEIETAVRQGLLPVHAEDQSHRL
jgi:hypothetical protein